MSRRCKSILFVLALSLTIPAIAPTSAWAEGPSIADLNGDQRAKLGHFFSEAQHAFERDAFADAILSLKEAFKIFPEPNILYRIGDAYERQGQLAEAVTYYTRYVEAAADAEDVPMVHRHISELQKYIAKDAPSKTPPKPTQMKTAVLFIDSTPPGAQVYIGDELAPRGVTPARIHINPGATPIYLEQRGYQPVERVLRIEAGETLSMVYPLQKITVTDAAPTDVSDAPGSAWPWVIGGVGTASLATGAGLLFAANSASSQLETYDKQRRDAHENGQVVPARPADYDQLKSDDYYFSRAGWALVGIGAVGVGAGIVWLTLELDEAEIAIVPSWGGASVRGQF